MAAGSSPPTPQFVLRGHESACNSAAFLTPLLLASGDLNGELRVWDLEARSTQTRIPKAHASSILSVSRLPQARETLVSCGRDETVKVWDLHGGAMQVIHTLKTEARAFCNASVDRSSSSADPSLVLTAAGNESGIQLWDLRSGSVTGGARIKADQGLVSALCLSSAKGTLCALIGSDSGAVSSVDLRMGTVTSTAQAHESGSPLLAMDFSPVGCDVVTGGADQKVQRNSLPAFGEASPGDSLTLTSPGTSSLAYRSDARLIVSAHWDGTLRLTEATPRKLKPLAILRHSKESRESLFGVAFGLAETTSMGLFASTSKDGTIAVWDVYADKMRTTHKETVV